MAFATILAVVAGLVISASGAVAHDIWSNVVRSGRDSEKEEVWVAKIAAVAIGAIAIAVAVIGGAGLNVSFMVGLAFAVAASANFPALLLALSWRRFNTTGAIVGVLTGVFSSILLVIISPKVWPGADSEGGAFGFYDLANPGIVSIPLGFIGCWVGTMLAREPAAERKFSELYVRSETGLGAEGGPGLSAQRRARPHGCRHGGHERAAAARRSTPAWRGAACAPPRSGRTSLESRTGGSGMEGGTKATADQIERELGELLDQETFDPPEEFARDALITDESVYEEAARDPEAWWAKQAEELDWFEPWDQVLDESEAPFYKWFTGGKLNASHNALDRHVDAGRGDRVAYHWRGEEGEERDVTYAELLRDVKRLANVLKERGVEPGDVVGIFLPMIPEVAVAMLACARIGAPHNVVFGGFSTESVKERMEFTDAKALITVDCARRKGKVAAIKPEVDAFLDDVPSIETVVVVRNTGADVDMREGRDIFYDEAIEAASEDCPAEPLDAEHPLYVLFTSGSTAKPKGILHTTGGYLTGVAWTNKYVFDMKPDEDVYWCSADVGWVTGHSYIVYGPLLNGATSVMYEGAPDYPDKDIWWELCERYGVTLFYTAPDGDPRLHEVGDRPPAEARPLEAPPARHRGRADQPQGLALVLEGDRRRALPGGRHLVADGDRPHHDLAASRRSCRPSPARPPGRCRASRRWCSTKRATRCRTGSRGCWRSRVRGRACCAISSRTRSATRRPTSPSSARPRTSWATPPGATRTGTSGSSAAWTTW